MQRSSTHPARWGNTSLTAVPLSPCFAEPERRAQQVARLARHDARLGERQRLAVVPLQERLVIERVDLRRPPVHEQENHALGPSREVARTRAPAGCADRPSRRLAPPRPAGRPGPATRNRRRYGGGGRDATSPGIGRIPVVVHGHPCTRVIRGRGTRWTRRSPDRAVARPDGAGPRARPLPRPIPLRTAASNPRRDRFLSSIAGRP